MVIWVRVPLGAPIQKSLAFMVRLFRIGELNDGEEPIGSERVVGERKPVTCEPYGARRTRLRECPVPLGSPLKKAP